MPAHSHVSSYQSSRTPAPNRCGSSQISGTTRMSTRSRPVPVGELYRHVPDLRPQPVAVVDLELSTACGIASRVVEAAARLRVVQRPVGAGHPLLTADTVAVPELDLGEVRRAVADDVEALAERPHGAVAVHLPLLSGHSVAIPELHGVAARGRVGVHVNALVRRARAVDLARRIA